MDDVAGEAQTGRAAATGEKRKEPAPVLLEDQDGSGQGGIFWYV